MLLFSIGRERERDRKQTNKNAAKNFFFVNETKGKKAPPSSYARTLQRRRSSCFLLLLLQVFFLFYSPFKLLDADERELLLLNE
jgi:hypothetical protein